MEFLSLRLGAFVCLAVGLLAQTPNITEQPASECENPGTTATMRTCEATRYASAQLELDSAYRGLMQHLDSGQKRRLRITQRAWLRFRDANADFQAALLQGGTLSPLARISSLTKMTRARTLELKEEALP